MLLPTQGNWGPYRGLFLQLLCHVWLFATPWTVACQAPLSMEFSRLRMLEWVAILLTRGSSWPRDRTQVSCIAGRFLTVWATKEAPQSKSNRSLTAGHHSLPNFIHYPELRKRAVTITWWTFSCFNTGNRDSSVFVLFQPKYRWQNMQAVKTYTVFKDIYKW